MNNFKRIFAFILPYKHLAILNAVGNILSVIFSLFTFIILGKVIGILFKVEDELKPLTEDSTFKDRILYDIEKFTRDLISSADESQALMYISIILVISFFFKNIFRYMAQYYLAPLRSNIIQDIRSAVHKKILKLPISYFSEKRKGDVITRVTADVVEIEWSVISILELAIRDPFTILSSIILMLTISWKLTLFVFIFLPISGFIVGKIGKKLKRKSNEGQQQVSLIVSILEENLSSLKIIKAFNAEQKVDDKFETENKKFTTINNSIRRRHDMASPMSEFLGSIIMCVVFWYGGSLILNDPANSLPPTLFISYIGLFWQLLAPSKNISQAYIRLQKGMASIDRVMDIIDTPEEITDQEDAKAFNAFNQSIEFKNVNFSYVEDIPVLKDVSFTVNKGETVALVGQSGSGKSTIADLIARYYDIKEGEINYDGQEIKTLKTHDLRQHLGIITQESILFNDTVENNITLGVDSYTKEDLIQAAKHANAYEFIEKLEHGFDTIIGDRGSKLSGGQRQRLSIARAILSNPDIMIMDEATSALDTESERLVQNALDHLLQNRTSIVIAHRLSTVINADKIIVLHEGKIVEQGTHKELLALDKYYKKLHDMQDIS